MKVNIDKIDCWFVILVATIIDTFIIIDIFTKASCYTCATATTTPSTTVSSTATTTIPIQSWSHCNITYGKIYYSPQCPYCQRELSEGGLTALARAGVTVDRYDVTIANYTFIQYIPTWIVNGNMTVGYQTLDQIKGLFQCQ